MNVATASGVTKGGDASSSAIKSGSIAANSSVTPASAVAIESGSAVVANNGIAQAKSSTLVSSIQPDKSASTMECYTLETQGGGNAVVCALKPPATVWIGNIFAFFALLISIGGLLYSLRKDRKARLQSIEDDFWLRKVISPIALEPLIKKITETVSNIPEDRQSAGFDMQACDEFGTKFQSEWNQLSCAMDALGLLSKDVLKVSRGHVSNIEDEVLRYCSNNLAGKIGVDGGCISRSQLQEIINLEMIKVMNCIKQYQLSKI